MIIILVFTVQGKKSIFHKKNKELSNPAFQCFQLGQLQPNYLNIVCNMITNVLLITIQTGQNVSRELIKRWNVTNSTGLAPINIFKTTNADSTILWAPFAVKPTATRLKRVLTRNRQGCLVGWRREGQVGSSEGSVVNFL